MTTGISRCELLRVLRAHEVFVEEHPDGVTVTLIRGDYLDSQELPNEVRPRQVRYFWRKLGIPIHHFWHPEAAEQEAAAKLKLPCADTESPEPIQEIYGKALEAEPEGIQIRLKKPSDQ